jgi:hypothetical protein
MRTQMLSVASAIIVGLAGGCASMGQSGPTCTSTGCSSDCAELGCDDSIYAARVPWQAAAACGMGEECLESAGPSCVADCDTSLGTCTTCRPAGPREKCAAKVAEYGYFNCQCNGSYKFPVPPQYTYHWPGMYSQSSVLEYNSPHRYPPLKDPSVLDAGALGDDDYYPSDEPGRLPLDEPPPIEPPSDKLQRRMGIQ